MNMSFLTATVVVFIHSFCHFSLHLDWWCTWNGTCIKPHPLERTPTNHNTSLSVWAWQLCTWRAQCRWSWVNTFSHTHTHTIGLLWHFPLCYAVLCCSMLYTTRFLWLSRKGSVCIGSVWRCGGAETPPSSPGQESEKHLAHVVHCPGPAVLTGTPVSQRVLILLNLLS